MPKVSVIVAIYKVEQYLEKCLDSVIKQTFQDLEIVLVDDGSPDKCSLICDEYAEKDNRIKVIHQHNQGSVLARQNGLNIASGDYVSFIDGDDWLEPNMYEDMIRLSEDGRADIIITGFIWDGGLPSNVKYIQHNIETGVYKGEKLLLLHDRAIFTGNKFYEFGIFPALWNKLIRRDFIMNSGITAPNTAIRMGDDAAVIYPLIARAKHIVVNNDKALYHYRQTPNSMSKGFDKMYFKRVLILLEGLRYNLVGNDRYINNLSYYALMMTQVGIDGILSRRCKWSVKSRRKMLKGYQKEFMNLGMVRNIEWSLFEEYDKRLLKEFLCGNINRMMGYWFLERIKRRLFIKRPID